MSHIVSSRGLLLGVMMGAWAGKRIDIYEKCSRGGLRGCGVGDRRNRERGGEGERDDGSSVAA